MVSEAVSFEPNIAFVFNGRKSSHIGLNKLISKQWQNSQKPGYIKLVYTSFGVCVCVCVCVCATLSFVDRYMTSSVRPETTQTSRIWSGLLCVHVCARVCTRWKDKRRLIVSFCSCPSTQRDIHTHTHRQGQTQFTLRTHTGRLFF